MGNAVTRSSVEKSKAVGVVLADGTRFSAGKAVIANITPPKLFGTLVKEERSPGPLHEEGARASATAPPP